MGSSWEVRRETPDAQIVTRALFSPAASEDGTSKNWIGNQNRHQVLLLHSKSSFFREIEAVGREIGKCCGK